MQVRRLGTSSLNITPIGLGAWAIGGEWLFGWGPQDDADSVAVITRAVSLGINWIDTAAVYGLGHSEEVVARALRDIPRAERPYVFTKCSLVWDDQRNVTHSLRPESIRQELDASLRRLETERIDLYQIHWPAWPSSPANHDSGRIEDAWQTLLEAQDAGKVRYLGVSNFDAEQLERIHRIGRVTSLQPPYSLVRRDIEARTLPWCRAHDVGVIVYSPMQSGLLSGKMTRERIASLPATDWRRRGAWFNEPNLSRALRVVDLLNDIAAQHDATAGEIAIAWTLRHPAVTGAIVGARRPDQLDGIIKAGTLQLTDVDVQEIAALETELGLSA